MKTYTIILFALICLAQWIVPGKMIADQESVRLSGKLFRFKTQPIDPYDPFRGKYIILSFEATEFNKRGSDMWDYSQKIYVSLKEDAEGFASVADVSLSEPENTKDYVEATGYASSSSNEIRIEYPFTTFYLEESKAARAERLYQENSRDVGKHTYAVVSVKNGDASLLDVMVDGKSLVDLVISHPSR